MLRAIKTGLWAAATAMLAAVAFAAAQDDDMAKAEKVFNTSCMACHELRKIQTQAQDAEGWTKIVNSMVQ
jgi:cytochrome c2